MAKIVVDIDAELLARAKKQLGTSSDSETVSEALAQMLRIIAFEREVEFAKAGGFADLLDPEIMKRAWR